VWPNLRASGEQKKSLLLVIIWNFDDSRCSVLCIDLQGSREKDRERVRTAETPARWNKFEQCQQRLHHVLLMETPVLWFLTLRKKMVVFAFVWASKASRPPCASCCLSPWTLNLEETSCLECATVDKSRASSTAVVVARPVKLLLANFGVSLKAVRLIVDFRAYTTRNCYNSSTGHQTTKLQ
jgi:hypothetical protein